MPFTFSQMSGHSGVTEITVSASGNSGHEPVVEYYTLRNGSKSVLLPLVQKPSKPSEDYISIKPSSVSLASSASSSSIQVQSNCAWVLVSDGWITMNGHNRLEGSGNTIVGIAVTENTGSTRTGGITGTSASDNSVSASTTVSQQGGYSAPYITLGEGGIAVDSTGSTTSVTVSSNIAWNTMTDSRWIELQTQSGSGDGSIVFTVAENTSDFAREALITVYGGGIESYLAIKQDSGVKEYIILSPSSFEVAASGSSGNIITVVANCDYDISADVDWITVNAISGSGNGSVSFTTAYGKPKTIGHIVFSNNVLSRNVTVARVEPENDESVDDNQ